MAAKTAANEAHKAAREVGQVQKKADSPQNIKDSEKLMLPRSDDQRGRTATDPFSTLASKAWQQPSTRGTSACEHVPDPASSSSRFLGRLQYDQQCDMSTAQNYKRLKSSWTLTRLHEEQVCGTTKTVDVHDSDDSLDESRGIVRLRTIHRVWSCAGWRLAVLLFLYSTTDMISLHI